MTTTNHGNSSSGNPSDKSGSSNKHPGAVNGGNSNGVMDRNSNGISHGISHGISNDLPFDASASGPPLLAPVPLPSGAHPFPYPLRNESPSHLSPQRKGDASLPPSSSSSSFPGSSANALPPPAPTAPGTAADALSEEERAQAKAREVYGERWAQKKSRIQKESPHGRRPGWSLRAVIVKSGDDCRQELLAIQLINAFAEMWAISNLPLYVKGYEVLVTSNKTALIEMVPDTLSVHTVKQRSAPGTNLRDHFFAKFKKGTRECEQAQRAFTESLAASSIICYLLQIKDRHNGNILIDDQGRLVHIDFGFLLSNSPGGISFETAPFKLTRELLEIMDSTSEGRSSDLFDYFKVLMIQGFLCCRKYHDRLLLLTRMLVRNSNFPCFKTGERAVKALEKRLLLSYTEQQCIAAVIDLISESLDAWRTRQYDYYQRVLNGIL
eukprot:CAMPEP_0175084902 /NCGR_PEP_ID=MMETSP0052_2-20121109/28337_1 /TAXON_ID=51329 ORGANISM="Polytomella parva, Strain SAG 63-3" /NCGR_SAMPLE_ID=MMETSP0052_2 /ASSEMBLY_ACC=CAM_ASM_000194 /LENGTH=437 /DNA_ID=CAMNT_0016356797 /DNA_START=28 /DNA_END=1341 /DNA_ORIENTATION=-